MYRLLLIFACGLVFVGSEDIVDKADDAAKSITTTKDGAKVCPDPGLTQVSNAISGVAESVGKGLVKVATKFGFKECPTKSVFHYYECCGDGNGDCCVKLQTWVIVVLAVIAAIILTSIVLSLLRCFFCRR